jgi:putative ABC transport system permease protein
MKPDGKSEPPGGGGGAPVGADPRLAGFGGSSPGARFGSLAPARTSLVRENVRMALEALVSTKMRSMLTLLGLMIGVGAVIAMMAVIAGVNGTVKKQIASLGSGVLYVSKYEAGVHFGDDRPRKARKDLTAEDAAAIAEFCPSAAGVSPEIQDMGYLKSGGVKSSVLKLVGATGAFAEANGWEPEFGRLFTDDEVKRRVPVCVLGADPANLLFPSGGAVGQWIDYDGHRFLVVGVFRAKGKFLGQNQDDFAIFPLPLLARQWNYGRTVDYLVVRPRGPQSVEPLRDEITELLRRRRGVRADQPNDFGITSQAELMDMFKKLTGVFFLVTILLSSIGLLVGGIGVMNMMLVSVRERTREIGVRAALGARRRDILGQFLIEAVTLTVVGGTLGIALGYSLAGLITLLFHAPMAVSPGAIALALGISGGIGVFFGWYPAYRASKLDPVEALRFE